MPIGKVIDFNFVGRSEHIMVTLKTEKEKNNSKSRPVTYTRWIIYNAESGNIDLDISNDPDQIQMTNPDDDGAILATALSDLFLY